MNYGLVFIPITEMPGLTGAWVNEQRQAFLAIPEIKNLMPAVEAAHHDVVAVRASGKLDTSSELGDVVEEESTVHGLLAHTVRCVYHGTAAAAEWELGQPHPDADRAAQILEARDLLFPDGLHTVRAGYAVESALAELIPHQLAEEPGITKLLKTIEVARDVHLGKVLDRAVALSDQLSQLEQRRAALETPATPPATGVPPAPTVLRARTRWLDVVGTVLSSLRHSRVSAAQIDAVRSPVVEAARTGRARTLAARMAAAKAKAAAAMDAAKTPA
jgi:hypothetical protein